MTIVRRSTGPPALASQQLFVSNLKPEIFQMPNDLLSSDTMMIDLAARLRHIKAQLDRMDTEGESEDDGTPLSGLGARIVDMAASLPVTHSDAIHAKAEILNWSLTTFVSDELENGRSQPETHLAASLCTDILRTHPASPYPSRRHQNKYHDAAWMERRMSESGWVAPRQSTTAEIFTASDSHAV